MNYIVLESNILYRTQVHMYWTLCSYFFWAELTEKLEYINILYVYDYLLNIKKKRNI